MKLVCIGTVADVAELKGENRLFVKHGLEALQTVANTGLKSLIEGCGLAGRKISEGDLGFRIGPRINAAGRMGMTDLAVRLFFSDSAEESRTLVKRLEELNSKRQKTEEKIFGAAKAKIEERGLAARYRCLVLGSEEWHRGVIGIVASKLKDHFHRPVILFAYEDGKAFGSGRSISECPLIDLVEGCRKYFLSYGGHRLAVGCSLKTERHAGLQGGHQRARRAPDLGGGPEEKGPDRRANSAPEAIDASFLEHYARLVPFGVGNPKPVFLGEGLEVTDEPKTMQGKHLKFWVRRNGRSFEVLGWDKAGLGGPHRKGTARRPGLHPPHLRVHGGGAGRAGHRRYPDVGERRRCARTSASCWPGRPSGGPSARWRSSWSSSPPISS